MMTNNPRFAGTQSGAALIMVLMLLIIITLLGLASMRGVLMQERMAASTASRAAAFQAAEAGMRQAELIARNGVAFPSSGCAAGRCANAYTAGTTPAWQASGFWADGGTGYQTGTMVGSGAFATAPKFVIEDYGTAAITAATAAGAPIDASIAPPSASGNRQNVYRITSYASMPNGGEVLLQSLYRR